MQNYRVSLVDSTGRNVIVRDIEADGYSTSFLVLDFFRNELKIEKRAGWFSDPIYKTIQITVATVFLKGEAFIVECIKGDSK